MDPDQREENRPMDGPLYLYLTAASVVYVLWDATRRKAARAVWAVASALAWPIVLPCWLATRPLLSGEQRTGGRAWNVLRSFVLTWTGLWGAQLLVTLGVGALGAGTARSDEERASALGFAILFAIISVVAWLVPTAAAMLIGLAVRRPATVEHGPAPKVLA
jgi:hypothetical protein